MEIPFTKENSYLLIFKNEDVEIGRIIITMVLTEDTDIDNDDRGARGRIHEMEEKIEECGREKEKNNEEYKMGACTSKAKVVGNESSRVEHDSTRLDSIRNDLTHRLTRVRYDPLFL